MIGHQIVPLINSPAANGRPSVSAQMDGVEIFGLVQQGSDRWGAQIAGMRGREGRAVTRGWGRRDLSSIRVKITPKNSQQVKWVFFRRQPSIYFSLSAARLLPLLRLLRPILIIRVILLGLLTYYISHLFPTL